MVLLVGGITDIMVILRVTSRNSYAMLDYTELEKHGKQEYSTNFLASLPW